MSHLESNYALLGVCEQLYAKFTRNSTILDISLVFKVEVNFCSVQTFLGDFTPAGDPSGARERHISNLPHGNDLTQTRGRCSSRPCRGGSGPGPNLPHLLTRSHLITRCPRHCFGSTEFYETKQKE